MALLSGLGYKSNKSPRNTKRNEPPMNDFSMSPFPSYPNMPPSPVLNRSNDHNAMNSSNNHNSLLNDNAHNHISNTNNNQNHHALSTNNNSDNFSSILSFGTPAVYNNHKNKNNTNNSTFNRTTVNNKSRRTHNTTGIPRRSLRHSSLMSPVRQTSNASNHTTSIIENSLRNDHNNNNQNNQSQLSAITRGHSHNNNSNTGSFAGGHAGLSQSGHDLSSLNVSLITRNHGNNNNAQNCQHITVIGFPASDQQFIYRKFSNYGNILSSKLQSNILQIEYEKAESGRRAIRENAKWVKAHNNNNGREYMIAVVFSEQAEINNGGGDAMDGGGYGRIISMNNSQNFRAQQMNMERNMDEDPELFEPADNSNIFWKTLHFMTTGW